MRAFMAILKDWLFVDGLGLAWDVVVDGENTFIKERNVINIINCQLKFFLFFRFQNYSHMKKIIN